MVKKVLVIAAPVALAGCMTLSPAFAQLVELASGFVDHFANQCQAERAQKAVAASKAHQVIMIPDCDGDRYTHGICDMDKKRCQAAHESYEAFMVGDESSRAFARSMFEITTHESTQGFYEGNVWTGWHLIRRKMSPTGYEWDWKRMTFDGDRGR